MNKMYLVLSVKQINRLANAASVSQKACKGKSTHCVVLDGLTLASPDTHPEQISSLSFEASVDHVFQQAKSRAALDKPTPSV